MSNINRYDLKETTPSPIGEWVKYSDYLGRITAAFCEVDRERAEKFDLRQRLADAPRLAAEAIFSEYLLCGSYSVSDLEQTIIRATQAGKDLIREPLEKGVAELRQGFAEVDTAEARLACYKKDAPRIAAEAIFNRYHAIYSALYFDQVETTIRVALNAGEMTDQENICVVSIKQRDYWEDKIKSLIVENEVLKQKLADAPRIAAAAIYKEYEIKSRLFKNYPNEIAVETTIRVAIAGKEKSDG